MHKIVARYADGRRLRGHTSNFDPSQLEFVLVPHGKTSAEAQTVAVRELKAIFFVKSFLGNPSHKGRNYFTASDSNLGTKVEVRFRDGEVMVGSTPNYSPALPGFWIFPADSDANTIKAFAVAANVQSVKLLSPARQGPAEERRSGAERRMQDLPFEGPDKRSGEDRRAEAKERRGILHWILEHL